MTDQSGAQSVTMADVFRIPLHAALVLDAARSTGDLGVRHAVWGSQRIVLVPLDGEVRVSGRGGIDLMLSLRTAHAPDRAKRAPAGAGTGVTGLHFVSGDRMERIDANLYEAVGDLTMGGVIAPAAMRMRDLGWTAYRGAGHRHTLLFSATLAREFWSWAVTARQAGWLLEYKAKLFLHTEWVPAPEADPAA